MSKFKISRAHERPTVVRAVSLLLALVMPGLARPQAVGQPAPGPQNAGSTAEAMAGTADLKLMGFLPVSRAAEVRFETLATKVANPDQARRWMRALTEEPHVAGTPQDYDTAVYFRDQLREMGIEAELVEYHVLLNYPRKVSAVLTAPRRAEIPLREEGNPHDKDSFSHDAFDAFHGYGASGTSAGQVVYVNYALPDDFKKLDELGISVKGRIVLARYGQIFRGLKLYNAQQRGAAGLLLYSDPADDGYMKGDVYPHGPFRPESAIQRGSVLFLSHGPGDPTTPGWASTSGAKRIPWEELEDRARIPSLPISYGAARPILKALAGPEVPEGWQGGLPFAYHVGPGPAEVKLDVDMDYAIRPIWNVMATIRGHVEPDQWILMGNHRDAWTYGAVDPNSGSTTMLQTARALSAAMKAGWKPRRSILLASWDGEEYGLVGSTEWGEHHAKEILQKCVMVLNVDSAVSGPNLNIDGVPSLRDLVLGAAADVNDPRQGKPLAEIWLDRRRREWADTEPISLDHSDPPFVPQLGAVGSGSDYTVFLDHLGVPILDVNFGGRYGVYHSMYDNLYWMEKFGDPEYVYHTTAARLYTRVMMRASSAEIVPLRFTPYAAALNAYRDDLKRRVIKKRRLAGTGSGDSAPAWQPDFSDVDAALAEFQQAAQRLDGALISLQDRESLEAEQLGRLNRGVAQIERTLIDPDGLPGRTWFKHLVYAPGLTTGYASWPLPGLRQALEDDDALQFERQAPRLTARLRTAAAAMNAAHKAAASVP